MPTNGNETLEDRYKRETYADFQRLEKENAALRRAARLIHDRHGMTSGSLEMGDCDEFCKSLGLPVWTWPLAIKHGVEGF